MILADPTKKKSKKIYKYKSHTVKPYEMVPEMAFANILETKMHKNNIMS